MEETLMMDDEELAEHILQIRDADGQSFEEIANALQEAENRGYETMEELREASHL